MLLCKMVKQKDLDNLNYSVIFNENETTDDFSL